jgi:nucleoside-diphosphate-sugar epimerase
MCPPDIYGKGKGLAKTWSVFAVMYVQECKKLDVGGIYYGEGTNTRSWVHIDDLMTVYTKVVEAAVAGGGGFGWNKEVRATIGLCGCSPIILTCGQGYYFAGTQEVSHIDIARAAGPILTKNGIGKDAKPVEVSIDQIDKMVPHPRFPKLGRYLFASNSRTRPHRAEKLWGYKGEARGFDWTRRIVRRRGTDNLGKLMGAMHFVS